MAIEASGTIAMRASAETTRQAHADIIFGKEATTLSPANIAALLIATDEHRGLWRWRQPLLISCRHYFAAVGRPTERRSWRIAVSAA